MRVPAFLIVFALAALSAAQIDRGAPLPRKPFMGAALGLATPEEAKKAGVSAAVKVNKVFPGLTADSMHLQAGDLIISLEGQALGPGRVTAILHDKQVGDSLKAVVWRDGKTLDVQGILSARPYQKGDGFAVVYDQVVSQGKRIRVMATHPEGKGPFPTVFFIGGIGAYTMDAGFDTIPYGPIFQGLATSGYATVRIDKPGQGDSEGPVYSDLTFDTELDAYVQALRMTKTLSFVDKDKVVIFGHSMGGCFGPLVASQEPVAGIAVGGTIFKTWTEYMLENSRRQSKLAGATAVEIDSEMKQLAAATHFLFEEDKSPAEVVQQHPELKAFMAELSRDGKTYSGVGIPFFQQLAKKNLPEAWSKVNAKTLVFWGEFDFVSTKEDHQMIAEAVNAKKKGQAEFHVLPQSDHGFDKTTSFEDSLVKFGKPGAEFNTGIVTVLKDWLKRTVG